MIIPIHQSHNQNLLYSVKQSAYLFLPFSKVALDMMDSLAVFFFLTQTCRRRSRDSAWITLRGIDRSIQPCIHTHTHIHDLSLLPWNYLAISDCCAAKSYLNYVADTAVCFVSSSDVLQGAFYKVFWRQGQHVGFLEICHSSGDLKWSYCLRKHKRNREKEKVFKI